MDPYSLDRQNGHMQQVPQAYYQQQPATAAPLVSAVAHAGADVSQTPTELYFQIADSSVGSVIGKGGANLLSISDQTGAKINISQKNDFYPGTNNRVVAIHGTVPQIHNAHILLLHRLQIAAQQQLAYQAEQSGGGAAHLTGANSQALGGGAGQAQLQPHLQPQSLAPPNMMGADTSEQLQMMNADPLQAAAYYQQQQQAQAFHAYQQAYQQQQQQQHQQQPGPNWR